MPDQDDTDSDDENEEEDSSDDGQPDDDSDDASKGPPADEHGSMDILIYPCQAENDFDEVE